MSRKEECLELYKQAFGDDGQFAEQLFQQNFEYCRYIEQNGKVAAMLFLLPCVLKQGEDERQAFYLYAAATDTQYRKQGFMSRLLKESQRSVNAPIFLKAATKELSKFYEDRGFTLAPAKRTSKGANVLTPLFSVPTGERYSDESEYEMMYYSENLVFLDTIAFDCPMD